MTKSTRGVGKGPDASPSESEDRLHAESSDAPPVIAIIRSILRVQADELEKRLLMTQRELATTDRPNAMQLRYLDDDVEFAFSGGVELALKVDGVDSNLQGATLVDALSSGSRISLPDRPSGSHFTFIEGGRVQMDGVPMPRPMRPLVAWDLHHLLSHLGSSPAPLPYSHSAAKTFQELLGKFFIERLGVNRGPVGRRDRLHGDLREARQIAGDDFMDELSVATADLTADKEFWDGVSPAVPPWRFLWVAGQPAEYTVHAGNDTLPGHLAERVLTELANRGGQAIWRLDEDGKKYHEPILGKSELETAGAVLEAGTLENQVVERLEYEKMLGILQGIPDFDLWWMQYHERLSQKQIAGREGVSQARVSQRITQFKAAARNRFPAFRPK